MSFVRKFIGLNRKCSSSLEKKFPNFFEITPYKPELVRLINKTVSEKEVNNVLEVGGIDRPLLKKSDQFKYEGLDIEIRKDCYEVYDTFIVQSIEKPLDGMYDLIISITLLEHVKNNAASVSSMFNSLHKNGTTHHYIPSKWHPYSIALRMIGPKLQKKLIPFLRSGTEGVTGYPAYFNYCSPQAMKKLFEEEGFMDIKVKSYYRANDYFAFFTPAFILVSLFENICKMSNLDVFSSGFIISARK